MKMKIAALAFCIVLAGTAVPKAGPAESQEQIQRAFNNLIKAFGTAEPKDSSQIHTQLGLALPSALKAPQPKPVDLKAPYPASSVAAADDEGWELVNQTRDLKIYTRKKQGSGIREVKAVGPVEAPPSVAWKVIGDYGHYTEFMPYVKKCRIVKKEGDRIFYVYQVLNMPFVSNRDFTIKITWEPKNEKGVYKSRWVAANDHGPPEKDGYVRVKTNEGSWILETLDGGKRTQATYYLYTDPGGDIPDWLANMANTKALPELFKAVRKRSKKVLEGKVK